MKATQTAYFSNAQVRCILPSPDGLLLATHSGGGSVSFYKTDNGALLTTITFQAPVLSMCWVKTSNSPQSLACLCSDGNVRLRKLDSTYLPIPSARLTVIHADDGDLTEGIVAFHADGYHLAIGFPGNITVWSLMAKAPRCQAGLHTSTDAKAISHIQFLSGHRLLVFFTQPGHIVEHDLKTNTIISQSRLCPSIVSVAISTTNAIAIDGIESGLQTYRLASALGPSNIDSLPTLQGPWSGKSGACLLFIREDVLMRGYENGEICAWNVRTGTCYGSWSIGDRLSTIALLSPHQSIPSGDTWEARIAFGGPTGLRTVTVRSLAEQVQIPVPIPQSSVTIDTIGLSLEWSTILVRALNFGLLLAVLSMLSRDYESKIYAR